MGIDLPSKAELWLPPRPAIMRRWDDKAARASFPTPVFCPADRPAEASFMDDDSSGSNLSSYSFSINVGTHVAGSALMVVAHTSSGATRFVTGVTIDGNAASLSVMGYATDGSAMRTSTSFWYLETPVSGTVTVTLACTSTMERLGCAVYRVSGVKSFTPYSTTSLVNGYPGSASGTLDIPSGGFVLSGFGTHSSGTPTWSWLGVDHDSAIDVEGGRWFEVAHRNYAAGATVATIMVASGSYNGGFVAAAFR